MQLENQVCSLELAKTLKELGVKQESYAYWIEEENEHYGVYAINDEDPATYWSVPYISAFTVAELGEMLPWEVQIYGEDCLLAIDKNGKDWDVCYEGMGETDNIEYQNDASLANALAKMLIYLLENKLITPPQ